MCIVKCHTSIREEDVSSRGGCAHHRTCKHHHVLKVSPYFVSSAQVNQERQRIDVQGPADKDGYLVVKMLKKNLLILQSKLMEIYTSKGSKGFFLLR